MSVQVKMVEGDKVPNLSQPECLKEWVVSTTLQSLYLKKDQVPTVGGGGSLDGHGNSRYHKDSIPRPQAVSSGCYTT